jgi:hypothetical protein
VEKIENLKGAILCDLGLRRNESPDCNEHYTFTGNENYYFILTNQGYFELHNKRTLKKEQVISDTKMLMETLLRLRNEK